MKRSLNNLTGYSIHGKNGPEGKVKDFLFDEEGWIVRYLDVDFEDLKNDSNRILIPTSSLKETDWSDKTFHAGLTREEIKSSPALQEELPVSREYEKQLNEHYNLDLYWPFMYHASVGAPVLYPPRPLRTPSKEVDEEELDTSLRSFAEVKGYRIRAKDDSLGELVDLIVDDEDWQMVYLIADTSRWRPWSKKVILSVNWLEKIRFMGREVSVNLTTDQIKEAPEFDPSHPIDMDYEKALEEYYKQLS